MVNDTQAHSIGRRELLTGLAGVGALGAMGRASASGTGHETVTLFHDTHFHGLFEDDHADIASYFGLIDERARAAENPFVLGNGDDIATSLYSSVFEGEHMIDALNASGLDYNTYGNHEFDLGPEVLAERVAGSEFPWVSANVVDERTGDVFGAEHGAERYVLREAGGVTLGFTGLCTEDTPDVSSPGEHVAFLDPAEAMESLTTEMCRAGADVIVVLSHLASPVAEEVAAAVDDIDVMVGDHYSEVYDEPAEINDAILSFVGDEFEFVGEIELAVNDGEVADYEFTMHTVAEADVEPLSAVTEVVERYEAELDEELDVEIGETTVELDVRRETIRYGESNVGNYVADVKREETGADVGLMNGGGLRSDQVYGPGPITRRTVVDVLPFPNELVTIDVDGESLRAALEHGVSEPGHGRFPQVSGMSFAYDPDAPAGERVGEVEVNGEALDPDGTYELATNDFVAGGGDGYEMFEGLADGPGEGPLLSTVVIDAIEAEGTISPEVEGRIELL
ncbi:bifunctional metallophosphatase/5'-nucleotidase [Halalkalicoccus tibetensis]|uniref:Bifunctional metallophosphatase/5'-nucleotidase n=1 Tax=Halalkalicoccus tibetensis TaxID=175632 RepID=A0ABD5V260_9EURY